MNPTPQFFRNVYLPAQARQELQETRVGGGTARARVWRSDREAVPYTPVSRETIFGRIIEMQGGHPYERQLLGPVVATVPKKTTPTSVSGVNEVHRVLFEAEVPDGYFKPARGLDPVAAHWFGHTRDSVMVNECVAWTLAREFGEPYAVLLAPVVFRELTIDPGGADEELLEGVVSQDRGRPDWDAATSEGHEQVLRAGFFDALVGQQDRHLDQHAWRDGCLSLFDHGFAFSGSTRVKNEEMHAYRRAHLPGLTHEELTVVRRLDASPDLLGVEPLLLPKGGERMRQRIARMIRYEVL